MPLSSGLSGRGNFKEHNVVYYDELLDAMDQQKAAWKQRVRGIGQGGGGCSKGPLILGAKRW